MNYLGAALLAALGVGLLLTGEFLRRSSSRTRRISYDLRLRVDEETIRITLTRIVKQGASVQ